MGQTGQAILRWTLAIIVLAGVCVYAITNVDDAFRAGVAFGGDASESPSPGTGPVRNGEANPEFDYALVGNSVGFLTTDGMNVGPGGADGLVLQFPLIDGDPNCVATVNVEVPVRSATQTAQLALFPGGAGVTGPPVDAAPAPEPITIPVTTPPIATTDGIPGPLSWDVAGLYRTWATQGAYDGGQAPEAGTPFTVVIRPAGDAPGREVIFASSESPDVKPRLVWTGAGESCGAA
jgi:hypothetical protein